MRSQHLVLDLHLVGGQKETRPAGEQRREHRLRIRVDQPRLGQRPKPVVSLIGLTSRPGSLSTTHLIVYYLLPRVCILIPDASLNQSYIMYNTQRSVRRYNYRYAVVITRHRTRSGQPGASAGDGDQDADTAPEPLPRGASNTVNCSFAFRW